MLLYQGFHQGEPRLCFYIKGSLREKLCYVSISGVPSGRTKDMFLYQGFHQGELMLCCYLRGSLRENLYYVSISGVPSGK